MYDEINDYICNQIADEEFYEELRAEMEAEYYLAMQEEAAYYDGFCWVQA